MSMEPKFLDRFTHEGRLKAQLLQAVADGNPADRIAKLQPVRQQLKENPAKYSQLWILLLNTVLQADSVQLLTETDLKEFEEIGAILLQKAKDSNTTGTLWSLLANAYELRGEAQNACRLFTRIYQTPFLDFRWKSHSIRELAKRRLRSDDYISMYSHYIRQAPEPMQEVDVLGMLTAYCSVTFSSATEQIEKAGELARQLLTDNIMLPCSYTTLGLYSLLIKKDAVDAISYFEKAFKRDMSNELALIGLLSAWIQDGNYENVDHLLRSQRSPLCNKPLIQAFSQFGTLLCWLESYAIGGAPPLTTNELLQFARLDLQHYVGDIFITAYARLHLVEGNAKEALVLLQSHIQKYPEQPRWHYYAAWAEMQLGEKEALCDRYHSLVEKKETSGKQEFSRKSWPGCWTIACLLLDTDPSLDEKYGLQLYLRETARTFPQYASVIRTRLDLASATYPLPFTWKPGSGLFEEDLEALRTSLGHALYTRNYARMKRYTRHSLFTHLPVADQKIWTGAMLLRAGDGESTKKQGPENGARSSSEQINSTDTIEQGRKLLEDVAHHYNYQRAVLILAVHYLECGLLSRAKRMLHSFMTVTGRADAKIQLLKQYIDRVERNTVADIGKSVQQSDLAARAYYAQGCLYLSEARYESAARAFDTALATPHSSLPENCYAFMQCAQFLAAPAIYDDIWHDIKQLSPKEQNPFLVWCAFLARLWYASPADILALWPNASVLFDHLDNFAEETRIVIAQAITRACQRATSQEQVNILMHMLSRIIATHAHLMFKRLQSIGIASAVCKQYLAENNPNRARDYLDQQIQAHPSNCFLVILLALTYLERQDIQEALYVLDKTLFSDSQPEQDLCRFLAALLKGLVSDSAHFPSLINEVIQRDKQCALFVDILRLFASGNSEEICKLIFSCWKASDSEILKVVKVPNLLPHLCAYGAKTKVILPQLVDLVQQEPRKAMDEKQQVMLARCLTSIGRIEEAERVWQELSRQTTLSDRLSQEFAVLLCHMAVRESEKENKESAVLKLQEAAKRVHGSRIKQKVNLRRIAHKLKLQDVIQKILLEQFPGMNTVLNVPGRYHGFQRVLESYPSLSTILSTHNPQLKSLWSGLVKEHCQDVHFLHMLAITYWEYTQTKLAKQIHIESYLTINAALWTLLLCTDTFWHDFSDTRITNNTGERENLSLPQQEQLFEEAIDCILSLSITHASRAFAEHRYKDARIHLRCLYLCSQGATVLQKTLQQYKLAFEIALNSERLQKMITRASGMLDKWCASLLKEAEEAFGSLDTLQEAGKNYEAAINKLMPFIDMRIPVKQVLVTCLDWYNDWCSSSNLQIHAKLAPFSVFLTIVHSASLIAEQLIPLCTKGLSFLPENRAIAQHLAWRGGTTHTSAPETALNFYRDALQWDKTNSTAKRWLESLQENLKNDIEDEDEVDDEGEDGVEFDDDDYYDFYDYDGGEF